MRTGLYGRMALVMFTPVAFYAVGTVAIVLPWTLVTLIGGIALATGAMAAASLYAAATATDTEWRIPTVPGEQEITGFFEAVARGLSAGYEFPDTRHVEWRVVVHQARQHGWEGEDKEGLAIIKTRLGLNSQYKVPREALLRQFRLRTTA